MVLSFITASKSSLAQTDLFYALNEHLSNESLGGICSCNSARHNSKELIQLIVASPPEFYKRPCQNLCSDLFKVFNQMSEISTLSKDQFSKPLVKVATNSIKIG